ncbi:carboxymuconolactone decarboxylase family protein [Mycobacterium sp. 236(2023)]|uniref:carboxymuconolactone decarboxylase family protein n=1 Tax=Mycobacterium sp. 236(2023) TaxID=3038163 RepID=UPI0024156D62|nr:carboxymuconolactone decarboxylase family protein [Mycobacterium sp. 236(2023)]MDG4664363.1 carboxymuconolactone decarboxylase family protein [Mycobacterium sp. 236(2023)]
MSTSNTTPTGQNDAAEHTWESAMAAIYEVDPPFMTAFANYYNATIAKNALDPKVRELIFIAIDAAATHLYNPGTLFHIKEARKLGATKEEILETLQLVTLVGVHSISEGVPLLLEALESEENQPEVESATTSPPRG